MRRTTCEGVRSSSAHSRSNTAFLPELIRIVSRAVRSSVGTVVELFVYILVAFYDNETIIRVELSRKYPASRSFGGILTAARFAVNGLLGRPIKANCERIEMSHSAPDR